VRAAGGVEQRWVRTTRRGLHCMEWKRPKGLKDRMM
jgi:hypothetical protein